MREQRLQALNEFIQAHQTVSLKTLALTFSVSLYTIRRDMDELVARGQVRKHYGGVTAASLHNTFPIVYAERVATLREEKQRIALQAASDIQDHEVLYIDAGTTTLYMADLLKKRTVTVVTNSLPIIRDLAASDTVELIALGGHFDSRTASFYGPTALETVERFKFDKVFLGTSGLSIEHGLTNYTELEAALKRAVMQRGNRCYVLVDHSKLGRDSLYRIGPLSHADVLVTDQLLPPLLAQYCEKHTIEVRHKLV